MSTFFKSHGYPLDLLQNALERVSSITRQEALEKHVRENEGRIPLVLIYHPLTSRVKHILLNNFKILTRNPATAAIFPVPHVAAQGRDCNLKDILVHIHLTVPRQVSGISLVNIPAGALACLYTTFNVSGTVYRHRCKRSKEVRWRYFRRKQLEIEIILGLGLMQPDGLNVFNRPFSSCFLPLCRNESKCETIHMKMSYVHRFIFSQSHFLKRGFARGVVLKQRLRVTRK